MFERTRGAPAAGVSCFGKLPFHPEFLRLGLDSAGAATVVGWVERAHAALVQGGQAGAAGARLAFAAPAPGGRVLGGVLRQSSDGSRAHPVALFVERDAGNEAWHLAPLALGETWTALAAFLDRPFTGRDAFAAALADLAPALDLPRARVVHQETMATTAPGPWERLTGATGDVARHMALNLLAVARAQREARSADEGVALTVALPGYAAGAALRASLWLDVLGSLAGGTTPTVVLREAPARLWVFFHPVDGAELAPLLANDASQQMDDLADVWQTLPSAESPAAAALDAVVGPEPAPLGELPGRLKALDAA